MVFLLNDSGNFQALSRLLLGRRNIRNSKERVPVNLVILTVVRIIHVNVVTDDVLLVGGKIISITVVILETFGSLNTDKVADIIGSHLQLLIIVIFNKEFIRKIKTNI